MPGTDWAIPAYEQREDNSFDLWEGVKMAIERADVIAYIKGLSVMELTELVTELEDVLGVSATPQMVQGVTPPPDYTENPEPEEQTEFTVKLMAHGEKKIEVIKAIRQIVKGLGLKEAKTVVESAPVAILEAVPKSEAEEARKMLEEAGATVQVA